ncbi:hypothetical protein EDD99_6762 [Streptomyces sp. 846.5]|nr:hypothetical protein [Streptomyces sp. 846.5]TDT98535.1 hypothetical protein EDD99_6762 [Streptomyces sp. 846.5]
MDFDEVADQLYALPPPQFTAARDTAAAQADAAAAERIRGLRRPTLGAWLANLLVREHPTESQALLELGADLRAAQDGLAGERLRELTAGRRAVVGALVQQAKAAAVRAGLPVGEGPLADLEQTLTTVLADRQAAEAFAAGRLTKPLTVQPITDLAPPRGTRSPAPGTVTDPDVLAQARQNLKEAERQAAAAATAAASARRALDRATARHQRARSAAEQLSARLDQARADERTAAEEERTLLARVETTDRDARRATGRARDAGVRVRHLDNRRIRDEQPTRGAERWRERPGPGR